MATGGQVTRWEAGCQQMPVPPLRTLRTMQGNTILRHMASTRALPPVKGTQRCGGPWPAPGKGLAAGFDFGNGAVERGLGCWRALGIWNTAALTG